MSGLDANALAVILQNTLSSETTVRKQGMTGFTCEHVLLFLLVVLDGALLILGK